METLVRKIATRTICNCFVICELGEMEGHKSDLGCAVKHFWISLGMYSISQRRAGGGATQLHSEF
jgi:hypothetical protein